MTVLSCVRECSRESRCDRNAFDTDIKSVDEYADLLKQRERTKKDIETLVFIQLKAEFCYPFHSPSYDNDASLPSNRQCSSARPGFVNKNVNGRKYRTRNKNMNGPKYSTSESRTLELRDEDKKNQEHKKRPGQDIDDAVETKWLDSMSTPTSVDNICPETVTQSVSPSSDSNYPVLTNLPMCKNTHNSESKSMPQSIDEHGQNEHKSIDTTRLKKVDGTTSEWTDKENKEELYDIKKKEADKSSLLTKLEYLHLVQSIHRKQDIYKLSDITQLKEKEQIEKEYKKDEARKQEDKTSTMYIREHLTTLEYDLPMYPHSPIVDRQQSSQHLAQARGQEDNEIPTNIGGHPTTIEYDKPMYQQEYDQAYISTVYIINDESKHTIYEQSDKNLAPEKTKYRESIKNDGIRPPKCQSTIPISKCRNKNKNGRNYNRSSDKKCSSTPRNKNENGPSYNRSSDETCSSIPRNKNENGPSYNRSQDKTCSSVPRNKNDNGSSYNRISDVTCSSVPRNKNENGPSYNRSEEKTCSSIPRNKNENGSSYNRSSDETCSSVPKNKNENGSSYNRSEEKTRSSIPTNRNENGSTYNRSQDKTCSSIPRNKNENGPSYNRSQDKTCSSITRNNNEKVPSYNRSSDNTCSSTSRNKNLNGTKYRRTTANKQESKDDKKVDLTHNNE